MFLSKQSKKTVKVLGSSILGLSVLFTTAAHVTHDAEAKVEKHTLGDRVWFDENKNGLQDEGESGVPGVKVHLTGLDTGENQETETDANGNYHFEVEYGGQYKIYFEYDNGYKETTPNVGGSGIDKSDNSKGNNILVGISEENRPYDSNYDLGLVTK